ncbi:GlyGly-CTERM sorting domain-containing protein [Vibrio splendidus]|uniref:DUF3466 family protein n=1 Tax=Vibrio splendidus TaxID=29497 RepID=UPI000D33E025|nr:DUF3466 family protein [Vibrio splendidus]MCC4878862.1 DUF3466 family protein [Vibrio splendidus]PTO84320.1 GlyGly-CTERM sorting domain-containing protein [Vibrio splendidus]PTP03691.1 GlyGly-CTERM sorting domain-containing protein [Vibrio splendidus]PTP45339.1 GlyGly-CTERM sorting domain-containing protein [Vibrio splendidus]PTP54994.1 GlyGly-CTERM sorting domain-containing protein [Vibrio splendidus]
MTCTKFKLTTVAALVLAATNANAALYKVVEVTPSITGASEIFGVAIQPGKAVNVNAVLPTLPDDELPLGCFDSNATNCADSTFKLAGETRDTLEAVSYREEVPFAMDAPFQYIQEFDDFENYCYRELRYSTCESWAQNRWNDTWSKERNDLTYVNARAFVEGGETFESRNTVINSLDDDAKPVGVKSEGGIRNNALFTTTAAPTGTSETRAWKAITANSTVYNVGSVSVEQVPTDTSEPDKAFSSKAAIWDGTTTKEIDWVRGGNAQQGDYFAQGSMRSIAIDESNSIFYGVGYNTVDGNGDLQDMNASVFVSNSLDISGATWTTKVISGAEVKSGSSNDDAIYSNSVATDINDNLFAVGYSKRNGYVPESGSAGNKIFVVSDASASTPTATYLSGGIFFGGSSGEAKAVNNFNEFVGQIDAETTREVDGSERRHRGFIYPYQATGTDASRIALFESKAWWLDDLTNDGNASGENNKFRIIDASDINDAGVISATAIKCTVGGTTQAYDTTSHNSYCGGAASNAVEEVVAVKLIPIAGATKSDIQTRSADTEKVDRQGGSLGWLGLTVLGLLGFRRKFK